MTEQAGTQRSQGATETEGADATTPETSDAASGPGTQTGTETDAGPDTSTESGAGAGTDAGTGTESGTDSRPRGREQRPPVDVGELVWKVATVLASVVRVVAYVIAVVLIAFVVLTIVGVNLQNGVAQVIGGVADATVLAFRDLFLVADPVFAVVVNYGLAAVFWVLVAEFGSRIVRWVGARLS